MGVVEGVEGVSSGLRRLAQGADIIASVLKIRVARGGVCKGRDGVYMFSMAASILWSFVEQPNVSGGGPEEGISGGSGEANFVRSRRNEMDVVEEPALVAFGAQNVTEVCICLESRGQVWSVMEESVSEEEGEGKGGRGDEDIGEVFGE